jgi:hypothetical protein
MGSGKEVEGICIYDLQFTSLEDIVIQVSKPITIKGRAKCPSAEVRGVVNLKIKISNKIPNPFHIIFFQ